MFSHVGSSLNRTRTILAYKSWHSLLKRTENAIDNWRLRKRISKQQPVTNSLVLISWNCSLGRYKSYLKSVQKTIGESVR